MKGEGATEGGVGGGGVGVGGQEQEERVQKERDKIMAVPKLAISVWLRR